MTTSETALDALVGDHLEFALRALGGEGSAAIRMEMAREHVRDALRGIRKIKDIAHNEEAA